MSNCHKQFMGYNNSLDIPRTTFDRLKVAKTGVEKQLRKYFSKIEGYNIKCFKVQGSKSINTMIRKRNDTVDIDFGVYFQPKPVHSPATVIKKVYDALYELRTKYAPIRKRKCVRVEYRAESKIHIDVPIFYLERLSGERNPHIATPTGWIPSDTTEFERWYKEKRKRNAQLTRLIRYLKGWASHQKCDMPKGVAITVLAATYQEKNIRDDVAFLETLKNIRAALKKEYVCIMPAKPGDDLLRKVNSISKQKDFFECIDAIIKDGEAAIKTPKKLNALKLWRKHLGIFFPIVY